jgi:D-alanine transaminase
VEVTRGAAPRAHAFPAAGVRPSVYATVNRFSPPEAQRASGAACITIEDVRWLRCDLKTIQLLPNVMAKQAAVEGGALDALMVRDGVITEGSHANVMAVIDGELRTHPADRMILSGITRAVVLELATELTVPVREAAFTEAELAGSDELFLTGTTTDVMPIVRVNGRAIGSGRPGPITERLARAFRERLDVQCGLASAAR